MKTSKEDWIYVDEFRRYNDSRHQLFYDGKWIDINTGLTNDLDKTRL